VKTISENQPENQMDKQLESSIAGMLIVGVILSALLVLIGGILYLASASGAVPNYTQFKAENSSLSSISAVLRGIMHFDPKSLIGLGILLLIATPVIRVCFCVVGFARQKDGLYVVISGLVLVILIYSLTQKLL
jgi:uncharacterized membrane protein